MCQGRPENQLTHSIPNQNPGREVQKVIMIKKTLNLAAVAAIALCFVPAVVHATVDTSPATVITNSGNNNNGGGDDSDMKDGDDSHNGGVKPPAPVPEMNALLPVAALALAAVATQIWRKRREQS
jgi:hypothetical protein